MYKEANRLPNQIKSNKNLFIQSGRQEKATPKTSLFSEMLNDPFSLHNADQYQHFYL